MADHRMSCRLCGARCGVVVSIEGQQVMAVRGEAHHPLSEGYICPKGRMLGDHHHDTRRFDRALVGRPPARADVGLTEMLDDLGTRLRALIDRHGIDSVGLFQGTQAYQEPGGAGSVLRFAAALGSRSYYSIFTVDNIGKFVAGLQMTGGRHSLDPKADFTNARLLLMFGVNWVVSHTQGTPNPVMKIRRVAERGEVWAIDPRRSEAANLATRHLPIRASTDAFLAAFLVRELLRDGADLDYVDQHTKGVDALRAAVEPHSLDVTAARVGVRPDELVDLVAAIRRAGTVAVASGTGTRMGPHPAVTEWLLYCLSIVTGSMDRAGGTILLGRGMAYSPPGVAPTGVGPRSRPELRAWGGQYPCAALADEIEAGHLKALISFGGNPAGAIADTPRLRDALRSLDVFAVHDIVPTQSTDVATHVMPGTSEFEDSALVAGITHDGRRFMQYSPAAFAPCGDRRPAWWYVNELGNRLGLSIFEQPVSEADALSAMSGFASLEQVKAAPEQRVTGDLVTFGTITDDLPNGRWDLAPADLLEQFATITEPPELVLIPRRQHRHVNWTLTEVTGRGGRRDEPDLLMNPLDAARSGVEDGDLVTAATANGELRVRARLTEDLVPGAVSIPHGHRDVELNTLTSTTDAVDPLSGMILQSGVPISVRRASSEPATTA